MVAAIIIIFIIVLIIYNAMEKKTKKGLNEKYSMPENADEVLVKELRYDDKEVLGCRSYLWKEDDNLHLVAKSVSSDDYGKVSLPIPKINYYTRIGDFYIRDRRIVSSANSNEEHHRERIETEKVDNRTTIVSIMDGNGNEKIIKMNSEAYEVLFDMLPNKDKAIVESSRVDANNERESHGAAASQIKDDSSTVPQQIRELAKLKDDGILSEEEFEEKKKELLSKI